LFQTLTRRDQELLQHSLFIGVVMQPALEQYLQGDFLIRNVLGFDREHGHLAVGAIVQEQQVVQFHLRDARTSHDDLDTHLRLYREQHQDQRPSGALLFSCLGRGARLYGAPDHDSNLFHEHLGALPLGGFFCNGEIGPVQGRSFLHGYTSSFGLFRPKR
ncbi:MAG TPA: FIST C-terminal domain-containing protein, partial [Terriglobales bacterium]|nr:FIST C-terminal domain-containing protein [Terriglobales bacterium]